MENKQNQIKRVCGFYVNECHFTAMILPYITKEIENKNQTITILQNSIKLNIKELLSNMNLNKRLQNKVLEINWNKRYPIKYTKLKEEIEIENRQANNINIIINGDKQFIQKMNQNIKKLLNNIDIQNEIKIINCYNIEEISNTYEVMEKHEFILNTSGIKKIDEVSKIDSKKDA